MVGEAVEFHQAGRVHALGNLAAEQQIEAAGLDDRVEGGVGDEVVDLLADHRHGASAVADHLHPARPELLGQVAGERVERFVIVVVDVDSLVVELVHRSHPLNRRR